MAKNRFRRKSRQLTPGPRILIVCEGEKTEPIYFDSTKRNLRIRTATIDIVEGSGGDPGRLLARAKRMVKEAQTDRTPYDEVWIVFDHDCRPGCEKLLQQIVDKGFNYAFSNPCFEVWYLLHFEDRPGSLSDGASAEKRLRGKFLSHYEKSVDVYSDLEPHRETAIKRAEKVRQFHVGNGNLETHDPSTTVDRIVRLLLKIKATQDARHKSST